MRKLVAAAGLAIVLAVQAGAQSHDPALGSGNIEPAIPLVVEFSPAARRGLIFLTVHCAQCHAVDRASASPLARARPFRDMHIRYPVSDLQRPLSEGIHPRMPLLKLTAGQLEDVMSYLKTLER
jgi:hypothetical protein